MGNNLSQGIVAAVALVVSAVALIATFMQVLQQYYASAIGYSQCNEKVMGGWAKTKTRRFSWEELRFEVEFDSPVIFVSPPSNKDGPIPDALIYFLDGTQESLDATWTTSTLDARKEYQMRSVKEKVHTADNERASWFILLFAIQRMESQSRTWQEDQYKALGPPGERPDAHRLPHQPPSLHEAHTMTVALQRKRKSWDTMPPTVTKPYATTTICHLIEIMALLGVYWKEFDRKRDRYRAEGNGFMVLGERFSDLGLIFSFQVYSKCYFEKNRVIPVDEVKELCFGYVPTIYRETLDQRRLEFPSDEARNLSSLQMSSTSGIAETLVLIGCNNNTVNYFRQDGKRTSHIFPVSFEILGMLSRTFHITNSNFTYIPNPTPDRWDKRSVSLVNMMEEYQIYSEVDLPGSQRNATIQHRIKHHIEEILSYQDDEDAAERLLCLGALHKALDDADEILTAKTIARENGSAAKADRPPIRKRDKSANKLSHKSPETDAQGHRREVVQDVLRSHIQEVLRLLNERDERGSDAQSLHVPDMGPPSPTSNRPYEMTRQSPLGFEDMDSASPDERQQRFMAVYFGTIRRRVVPFAAISTGRRASSTAGAPPGYGLRRRGTGHSRGSSVVRGEAGGSAPATPAQEAVRTAAYALLVQTSGEAVSDSDVDGEERGQISPSKERDEWDKVPGKYSGSLAELPVSHDDIWCTLVFRMICWLMLHDFDKADVQVSKSELLGSRMPVYIA